MSWHKWVQLGLGLTAEIAVLPHVTGTVRAVNAKQIQLLDVINDPLKILNWKHYSDLFQLDPYNLGIAAVVAYTVITGTKYALSGKIKLKGNYDSVPDFGSGGTAKWMSDQEVKRRFYKSQKGIVLGSLKPGPKNEDGFEYVPFKLDGEYATLSSSKANNENVFVIGPSGTSKTVSLVLPMIYRAMDLGESIVCTDLKGELHEQTRKDLEKNGYDVYVLDFIKRRRGNHWNLLTSFDSDEEDELRKTAHAFVQGNKVATGKTGGGSDPMWEKAEINLISALFGFVTQKYPKEERLFEKVVELLHTLKDEDVAEGLFEMNGITGAPASWFRDFLFAEDKTRSGVLIGTSTTLSDLATKGLKLLTSKNDFSFEDIAKKKTAVFVMIPPQDKTYAAFISVFWQQLLDKLYNIAFETPGGSLKLPVRCILEEKANIGKINALKEVVSTSRSLGIKITIVYQDINQAKEQYGDQWETLAGNCHHWVILGANDNTTSKYISTKLGTTTVKVQQTSTSKDSKQLLDHKSASESYSYQQRALMTQDEVERLDEDQLIIFPRAADPVILYKVQYQHWKYRFCEPSPYIELPLLGEDAISKDKEMEKESKPEPKQTPISAGPRLRSRLAMPQLKETSIVPMVEKPKVTESISLSDVKVDMKAEQQTIKEERDLSLDKENVLSPVSSSDTVDMDNDVAAERSLEIDVLIKPTPEEEDRKVDYVEEVTEDVTGISMDFILGKK